MFEPPGREFEVIGFMLSSAVPQIGSLLLPPISRPLPQLFGPRLQLRDRVVHHGTFRHHATTRTVPPLPYVEQSHAALPAVLSLLVGYELGRTDEVPE